MKTPAKLRKILQNDCFRHTCGYLHRDGIVILERATATIRGMRVETEIIHIVPGEISVYISGNTEFTLEREFKGRIVFHNASLLLNGIKRIEIYRDNKSPKMEKQGITSDTAILLTEDGMTIRCDVYEFCSSDITIQNDKTMSVMDWDSWSNKDRIIWYGEKPEQKLAA